MNYPLSKVMKQIRGVSYSKNDASLKLAEGLIPVLRAGNIQNSRIIHEDFVYIPKRGVKDTQLLRHGDILIAASSGSISIVGKAAMILEDINAGFGAFCKVLRPNEEIVNKDYFKFFFETPYYKNTISQLAEGANINNLKKEHFDNLEIPLPSLPQQQIIANILDAADELRQNDKILIAKFDKLIQALFLDMFGDPMKNEKGFSIKKLEEFYSSKKEGTKCGPFGGALKKEEFVKSGIPVWNMDNISKMGELVPSINLWITDEKYKSLSSYSVINDDIIISRAGTVGKMCVVNDNHESSIISTNLIRLRLNKRLLHPIYFVSLMTYFKDRIGRLQSGSEGAFSHMNTGVLNDLKFPYPPINLQNQFTERRAIIEEQKAIAQKSLEKSEELFNSLLQKAFKGELI